MYNNIRVIKMIEKRTIGIVCEYNPFHNGHLYQIKKIKELYKDSLIIIVMSSSFMQRGEASIINKWDKTKIALEYGIDLVVELPFVFSTQSADIFAKVALTILNHLKIDTLIFGSESNDIKRLLNLASIQLNDPSYNNLVKDYLDLGINYPTAMSKALEDLSGYKVNTPNDLLALSYIKEIINNDYPIEVVSIKRSISYHSKKAKGSFASASFIRECLEKNIDVSDYVPKLTNNYLKKGQLFFTKDYFPFLKYQILNNIFNLDKFQTVDEGLPIRIQKNIVNANDLEEFIMKVKTKRYTYNKLKRMSTHILTNFTKEDNKNLTKVNYIRVLGFNNKGKEHLNKIKHDLKVPLLVKYDKLLSYELKITSIYASILNTEDKIKLIESEYKNKPIIKED